MIFFHSTNILFGAVMTAVTCTGPYVQLSDKSCFPLDEDVNGDNVDNGGVNIAVTICFSAF